MVFPIGNWTRRFEKHVAPPPLNDALMGARTLHCFALFSSLLGKR